MKSKKIHISFLILLIPFICFSQSTENIANTGDTTYVYVEQMPEFPGGVKEMLKYVYENINYPEEALLQQTEGKVIIRFEVKNDGSIGKTEVLKSDHKVFANEAVRLVKSLPMFKPGMKDSIPVNVWQSIPIQFKLNNQPFPIFDYQEMKLNEYILSKFRYPEEIEDPDIYGEEVIKLFISEDGFAYQIEFVKSLHPLIDNEINKICNFLPQFRPAKENNIPVKSIIEVSLNIDEPIFYSKKDEPEFLNSENSFKKYIKEQTQNPEEALYSGISGDVKMLFEVAKSGDVGKIRIYSSPHLVLTNEAKKIINSLPKFKPEYLKNKPVNTWNFADIHFDNNNLKVKQAEYSKGEIELYTSLSEKIKENLKTKEDSGLVSVIFRVNTKGDVDKCKILEGINARIDSSVVKSIMSFSGFIPGKVNEEIADTWYFLDLYFNDKKFVYVREIPEFPGGELSLRRYVSEHILYPAEARENGIQGTVYLRFEVTSSGNIGTIEIQKGVHHLLNNEAVKVLKSLPKFEPGKENGIPVNVWYSIPVTFKIN